MKILTSPWKDYFLYLVRNSKKSIKMTSPFVKQDVSSEILKSKRKGTSIELITSFKIMNIYSGALDIAALEDIININGVVKSYPRLHSKVYLFDEMHAIISSGNLTSGGLRLNYEYGIYIDDRSLIDTISSDFQELSYDEKTGIIKNSDLHKVKEIIGRIPKSTSIKIPDYVIDTPEETYDVMEIPPESISKSLSGWKLEVFKCINSIPDQRFSLNDVNRFEEHLKVLYPKNGHITDKIRQQLQYLRDLGLIEFLGHGNYKKLWK